MGIVVGVSVRVRGLDVVMPTRANASSCSVLTPKRGRAELERLELCVSFFTPLM